MILICDFFSGLHSWTKPHKIHGVQTQVFSIDNNPDYSHNTSIIDDFLKINSKTIMEFFGDKKPNVIYASIPCTTYSIASCSKHWTKPNKNGERFPKSNEAVIGLKLLNHTLKLIEELKPDLYFIENPRGLMRKMRALDQFQRHTIWHCQYGETNGILRAKPTDIWTNSKDWIPRDQCKNNNPQCKHERAPRGSKTGTQGLSNNKERSIVPYELCEEIMLSYLNKYGAE